nr:hypothetical protein [Tanacetum cinerariifolium]
MVKRFEMSMMGEMKFFLGLQVNQFSNVIFINQSKYILDILKRSGIENCDTVTTLMVEQAKLKLDLVGKPVDHTDYRSMIGSLMYVTSSRPDIMFSTCLWYPKDYGFDLTAYSDADHAGCHLDRKSNGYQRNGQNPSKTGQNQARNGKHGEVNQVNPVKVKPDKTGHGFGKAQKPKPKA